MTETQTPRTRAEAVAHNVAVVVTLPIEQWTRNLVAVPALPSHADLRIFT